MKIVPTNYSDHLILLQKKISDKLKNKTTLINIIFASFIGILIFICNIYSTKLFAQQLSPYDFGLFSITRRYASTIYVIFSAGLSIGIVRYIALNTSDSLKQSSFVRVGIIFLAFSLGLATLLLYFFNIFFSKILFGDEKFHLLVDNSIYLIIAFTLVSLLSFIYRGYNKIIKANLIQFLCIGLVPVLVGYFFIKGYKLNQVIVNLGIASLCISIIPFISTVFKHIILPLKTINLKNDFNNFITLMKYCLPRIPCDFAGVAQTIITPYLALMMGYVEIAGFLSVAQYLLKVIDMCAYGISFVLFPKVAEYLSKNYIEKIKLMVIRLLSFSIHIGIYITLHTYLFIDKIVLLWLGEKYIEAIPIMKIVIFALGFYLIVVNLRNVIDAIEFKAINTLHQLIATGTTLALNLIVFFIFKDVYLLIWGFTIGHIILGLLTMLFLHKKYNLGFNIYQFKLIILLNIVLFILSFIVQKHTSNLLLIILCETFIFTLYIFILKYHNVKWMIKSN